MIIELPPVQIVLELIDPAVMVGVGITVIVVVKLPANELTQPVELVPLIVYTVVAIGLTVKLVPVNAPGINV